MLAIRLTMLGITKGLLVSLVMNPSACTVLLLNWFRFLAIISASLSFAFSCYKNNNNLSTSCGHQEQHNNEGYILLNKFHSQGHNALIKYVHTDFLSSSLSATQPSESFNSSTSLIVTKFWRNRTTYRVLKKRGKIWMK